MKTTPATHAGLSASSIVLPPGSWATVLEFLIARFPAVTPDAWRSRMQRGLITGGDGAVLGAASVYASGATVHYYRELEAEQPIPFAAEILFEDEQLLVADKPHFLPVIPSGRYLQETLLVRLKNQTGLDDLVPLHRIDRGTAGVVVFSKSPETRGRYQQLFPRHKVEKVYQALAPTLPAAMFPLTHRSRLVTGEPFFRMREAEGAANSETQIEVLETRGALSLYRLRPITGRKHQLRVHLAALGAPIVNDDFYPELVDVADDDYSRPLQLLARCIAFDDPVTWRRRCFESRRKLSL